MEEKFVAIKQAIRNNKKLKDFQDMKAITNFLEVYYERMDGLAIGEMMKLCTMHNMIFWLSAKGDLIRVNILVRS